MSNKIIVSKNGPYLVSGSVPLAEDVIKNDDLGVPRKTVTGKKFKTADSYALCRCGNSENKPYCDGHHAMTGFDGTETADNKKYEDKAVTIKGPGLILKDVPHLCAGLGFCHRGMGTWDETQNSADPASKKSATESACACSAGRLVACDKKTKKNIEPKFTPSIGVYKNGPLFVKGGIPVVSEDKGTKYEVRNRVTLCRCGKSGNKPFCDASHEY